MFVSGDNTIQYNDLLINLMPPIEPSGETRGIVDKAAERRRNGAV